MGRLPVSELPTTAREMDLGKAEVYHLPDWHSLSHPQRLQVMRQVAERRGRDPRIAKLSASIIRKSKAQPREYAKQAAALLAWVQHPRNCYYLNEPGERLQDPIYTLEHKHGDCDDMAILLCAMFESVGLPWRFALSGLDSGGRKIRYIEGASVPQGCNWAHVYCMVGTPPFKPSRWYFCEPTVRGVPLGWDVISGDSRYLPEMSRFKGPTQVIGAPRAPRGFRPFKPHGQPSPAYAMAQPNPSLIPAAIGGAMAETVESSGRSGLDWQKIAGAVVTGVAVSVLTTITLDWLKGEGMWEKKPALPARIASLVKKVA